MRAVHDNTAQQRRRRHACQASAAAPFAAAHTAAGVLCTHTSSGSWQRRQSREQQREAQLCHGGAPVGCLRRQDVCDGRGRQRLVGAHVHAQLAAWGCRDAGQASRGDGRGGGSSVRVSDDASKYGQV